MESINNWEKIKEERSQLPETEWIILCRTLYTGWENFLADKLRLREEQSLVLEILVALATRRCCCAAWRTGRRPWSWPPPRP